MDDQFSRIVAALLTTPGVSLGTGRRGFGSNALCADGRIFAMVTRGQLVFKLPAKRVDDLCAAGTGVKFEAGKGRPMAEWVVLIDNQGGNWMALAKEALQFVARAPRRSASPPKGR